MKPVIMIAVLLATYNGKQYIEEQLDSLLAQSCQNFICYISDDGSSDKTPEIIHRYIVDYPNKFVLLEKYREKCQKKQGAVYNFMNLLSRVEADYYLFCDQDDIWNKDKIETLYQCCRKDEGENSSIPSLVFSDLLVVDENLETIASSFMKYNRLDPYDLCLEKLIVQNVAPGCASFFNRALREEMLKAGDVGAIGLHDWWAAIVAAAVGKITYIDRPLVLYRQHSGNEIGALKDTGIRRFLWLFFQFISFSHIQKTKQANDRRVKRAGQLKYLEIENEKYKRMIEDLSFFYQYPKIKRMFIFFKYGLHRNKRDLWMYLWL